MERDSKKDLELCKNATPGLWKVRITVDNNGDYPMEFHDIWAFPYGIEAGPEGVCRDLARGPNAQFIVAAREALPYWIHQAQYWEDDSKSLWKEFMQAQEEITQLRSIVFCQEPRCDKGIIHERELSDYGTVHYLSNPCPLCGPLRDKLRGKA